MLECNNRHVYSKYNMNHDAILARELKNHIAQIEGRIPLQRDAFVRPSGRMAMVSIPQELYDTLSNLTEAGESTDDLVNSILTHWVVED